MTLTVLYFAAVKDLVGKDEEQVDVVPGTTVGGLGVFLAERHPALAGRLGAVRFARNETFADEGEVLAAGDVVALIPPVAGG
jgi:molybdopterin converting factor subunit 1